MSLPEALLKVLNNNEEPLNKRLKIADTAFNASEFQLHHKEALLLKWIINSSEQLESEEISSLAIRWLSSREFNDLTQNDINNDHILSIVQIFQSKLLEKDTSISKKQRIFESVLLLCDNKVFQQYFKYNVQLYCQLLSLCLERIELPLEFIKFITKPYLFSKNILVQENFLKYFLDLLYPVLAKKALEFTDNQGVFDEIVRVIQKCIMQGNIKQFQSFYDQLLDPQNEEKEEIPLPKSVFKFLSITLQEDSPTATTAFKLFFSAFSECFKDSQLSFKCLIFLTELLQFDISKDFNIKLPFKQKTSMHLSKSLDILLAVLSVASTKSLPDSTVSNITCTEFLRKILMSLIFLNVQNSTVLEIILKCILVNPLVIEPMVNSLIVFVMIGNNGKTKEVYEKLVVTIFEVFAKLHRVENFMAKLIPALKNVLMADKMLETNGSAIYGFKGNQDIQVLPKKKLSMDDIFTNIILDCFTKCLNGLASWQVINVFKTLLFHLKSTVEEYADKSFEKGPNKFTFLEILGTLTTCLLQSVKIADHTIPQNVVVKFVKGLEDLKGILKDFGAAILKREHNHITMRTFLKLSFTWAEIYITLTYYSMNKEVQIVTVIDKMYSTVNLKYLHSYMDVKEWQLVAQRITNFGEYPCKKLLQKLYIQKLRAMLLFEKNLNEDIVTNIIKTVQTHMDDTWRDLLLDRFAVGFVVPKMDRVSLIFLAEQLIENSSLYDHNHIMDSTVLTNATAWVVMSKINKLFKLKRKHDVEQTKNFGSKVFSLCPEETFFSSEDLDINECIEHIMIVYENWETNTSSSIESKQEKLLNYFSILKKVPFIYSNINIQKVVLLFLLSLSTDTLSCSEEVRKELESLIVGVLQACKFPLTDVFKIQILGAQVLTKFDRHEVLFSLLVDNAFRHEKSILNLEPLVSYLVKNMGDSKHLSSSILILQAANKVKKSKMDFSTKEKAHQYKEKILTKMAKLVCKSDYLIEAYATCLKHYLSLEKDSATLKKLLDKLGSYIEHSLENISNENKKGCAILFNTVLQNKSKIGSPENDVVLKIWNSCKKIDVGQDYSHLVKLIVTLIPNDEFDTLVTDLFSLTNKNIKDKNYPELESKLKMWESILTCDVNPTKMKIWQEVLENLIYELLYILKNSDYYEALFKSIIRLDQSIIQAHHFILSPPLIDMFIMTTSILMRHEQRHFESVFSLSIQTLEILLKYRNAMVMDRLPAFLQQYRALLNGITARSNSEDVSGQNVDVKMASDCVHTLEKLTKNLVACKKDMGRIAVFLIADILQRYEQINLYPNVKLHLNNCVYSLISLCDHHSVSYLMRVLSNASTEMFKIMYEHYKKYYMFTGKV